MDLMLPRVDVQVSNLLIMLIAIVFLLMIVCKHVEYRIRMMTRNPTGYLILRMCHIFNKSLNRVLTLILKSMLNSQAFDLGWRQLSVV